MQSVNFIDCIVRRKTRSYFFEIILFIHQKSIGNP